MTPLLRKCHRYTWFSLAVLLPMGWLAAIWAIPDEIWQTPVRSGQPAALPVVIQSIESGDFVVQLRRDSSDRNRQIEVFIKKPLENPNTTIVVAGSGSNGENRDATLLGLLGTRGTRRFDLDSLTTLKRPLKLILEDRIQGRILRTITFE